MRDPTVNAKVEAAIVEADSILRCYVPLGIPPSNEDADAKRYREAFNYVSGSQDMPEHIRAHLLGLLAKNKRNERKFNHMNRNLWLALAVEHVHKLGFPVTSDNAESACRIVQKAASAFRLHLSARTIEDAWLDHKDRLPGRVVIVRGIVRTR